MAYIKVATDFSETPGGRTIKEGKFSGEEFRDSLLLPKYEESVAKGEKLEIDFDGTYGCAPCFLEEAFGGLVRKYHKSNVYQNLHIISFEDTLIPQTIREFLSVAENVLRVQ